MSTDRKRSELELNSGQVKLFDAAMRMFAESGSTSVNISELAVEAGVSRGTVYNNLKEPEHLFEQVAANLADEMHRRVTESYSYVDDPAARLAIGIRLFVRRAHEEPHWGRFIVRFAFSNTALQGMWLGPPAVDLRNGIETGRYTIEAERILSTLALIAGTVLSAIFLVLEGHKTWRDSGSEAVEFVLRSLGIDAEEARAIAGLELPLLAK